MVTTFTFGEDQYAQFRVIMVTDPHTHRQTNRQDRLQYTAPLSNSAQCKYVSSVKVKLISMRFDAKL